MTLQEFNALPDSTDVYDSVDEELGRVTYGQWHRFIRWDDGTVSVITTENAAPILKSIRIAGRTA